MTSVAYLTARPKSFGKAWFLCRECDGTGEVRRAVAAESGKTVEIKPEHVLHTGKRCEACGGKGLVLR